MLLAEVPVYHAGGGFPWGLLIIGGILYFLWRNGMFDGRGRFGNGGRYGGYGQDSNPAPTPGSTGQGTGPGFRGPRDVFEEWHREAHQAAGAREHAPASPSASAVSVPAAAPGTDAPASRDGEPAR